MEECNAKKQALKLNYFPTSPANSYMNSTTNSITFLFILDLDHSDLKIKC